MGALVSQRPWLYGLQTWAETADGNAATTTSDSATVTSTSLRITHLLETSKRTPPAPRPDHLEMGFESSLVREDPAMQALERARCYRLARHGIRALPDGADAVGVGEPGRPQPLRERCGPHDRGGASGPRRAGGGPARAAPLRPVERQRGAAGGGGRAVSGGGPGQHRDHQR